MSTSTSRLALTKPDVSDMMNIGDNILSRNYTILDGAVGAPTFTSGTRPSSPWAGRVIFESDTGNVMFWNGSAWAYWGNTASARQFVSSQDPGNASSIANTETLLGSSTFTATQNRRYRIEGITYGEHTGAINGAYLVRLRWASGSSVTTAGTLLRETYVKCNSSVTTGQSCYDMVELNYTSATGTITVGIFVLSNDANTMNFNGATDSVDVQGRLIIRDWSA